MDFSKVTAICNNVFSSNKKNAKELEKTSSRNTNNASANLRKREIKRKDKILSKVVMANLESSSDRSSHLGKKMEESKKGPAGRKSSIP